MDQSNFLTREKVVETAKVKIETAIESAKAYKVTPRSPRRIWKPAKYQVSKPLERLF